jgi:hypothetical protein
MEITVKMSVESFEEFRQWQTGQESRLKAMMGSYESLKAKYGTLCESICKTITAPKNGEYMVSDEKALADIVKTANDWFS